MRPKLCKGEIYYVDFDPARGSEQAGHRPAVVLQGDAGNRTSPTTIVAPVTSRPKPALAPHVALPASSGLCAGSTVLLEQVRVVDRSRMGSYVGAIGTDTLALVDRALAISLGMKAPAEGKGVPEYGHCEGVSKNATHKPDGSAAKGKSGTEYHAQENAAAQSIMTLCSRCHQDYEDSAAFDLCRVDLGQKYKEPCTRCSVHLGYDYVIEER
jgi:mRNA interferase MazF